MYGAHIEVFDVSGAPNSRLVVFFHHEFRKWPPPHPYLSSLLEINLGGTFVDTGVSENSGTPKSSILIGFSLKNHPFWGTPIFGNTHMFVFIFRTVYDFW